MNMLISRKDFMYSKTKEINDKYFFTFYKNDQYLFSVEDLTELSKLLNMPIKEILRKIRNNKEFNIQNGKAKIYLYDKEEIKENYRRKK